MLQEVSDISSDVSVFRRLSFAAISLQKDVPKYWELVGKFGFKSPPENLIIEKIKVFFENVEYIDSKALLSDRDLQRELLEFEGFQGHPLGVVLVSAKQNCELYGGKLLI